MFDSLLNDCQCRMLILVPFSKLWEYFALILFPFQATKAAYKWLKSPSITEADITRGKADLKAAILFGSDNNAAQLESLGQQAILKGRVASPLEVVAAVENINANDVKSVRTLIVEYQLLCNKFDV